MFRRFAPLCAKSLVRRPHPAATPHPRIARPNQAEKADEATPGSEVQLWGLATEVQIHGRHVLPGSIDPSLV